MAIGRIIPMLVMGSIGWHSKDAVAKRIDSVMGAKDVYLTRQRMETILRSAQLQMIGEDNLHIDDLRVFIRRSIRLKGGGDPSVDFWGTRFQHRLVGAKMTLISAGPDKRFSTQDDFTASVNLGDY